MQWIVFLLRIAPFLYSYISLAESTHPLPIKHSTTKGVVYMKPGEIPDIKTQAELEHHFRVGIAECEIESCRKEIVCLNELKTTIRRTIKNLDRTDTPLLVSILIDIDDSRDICEKELAKEDDKSNFDFGKLQIKTPSNSPIANNTQEAAPSPTPLKASVVKHLAPPIPQTTHLRSIY